VIDKEEEEEEEGEEEEEEEVLDTRAPWQGLWFSLTGKESNSAGKKGKKDTFKGEHVDSFPVFFHF
jgi:hypothetical protein